MKDTGQITQVYIDETSEAWATLERGLRELWAEMKPNINIPGKGVDKFSAEADSLWMNFKNNTVKQWTNYKNALEECGQC